MAIEIVDWYVNANKAIGRKTRSSLDREIQLQGKKCFSEQRQKGITTSASNVLYCGICER